MLKPSQGRQGVVDFVVDTVSKAGPNPCPPMIVGVGIGGTFEKVAYLAKQSLLREVGSTNPDPRLAELEDELERALQRPGHRAAGAGRHAPPSSTSSSRNCRPHRQHAGGRQHPVPLGAAQGGGALMDARAITTPLTDEVVAELRAGDRLLITGIIYTGRDAAHKRLVELIDQGEPLPFDLTRADHLLRRAHPGQAGRGHRLGRADHLRPHGRLLARCSTWASRA